MKKELEQLLSQKDTFMVEGTTKLGYDSDFIFEKKGDKTMKANRMWLFSDVLEKNKKVFKVPVYQRNYDWSNIQCEKLFQDIMKANEKNCQHFTGTVVYIDDVNGGSGLNEVLIIDGQQRITTMYILLKALYDASKGISARIESEIEEVMFNRHKSTKLSLSL